VANIRSAIAALGLTAAASLVAPLAAHAQQTKAEVRGDLPEALRELIVDAIGEVENPPASRLEARRRAREAGVDAIAVLESRGYYAYIVTPEITDDSPSRPYVDIVSGPRFTIAVPLITWIGEPPPPDVQETVEAALGLEEGSPAQAGDIVAAEGRAVAAAQAEGYADALAVPVPPEYALVPGGADYDAIVDHDSFQVIPDYYVAAGPLVRLDGIDFQTEGRTTRAYVERLVPWEDGDVYSPEAVAELERRLLDAAVYESVTVALAKPEDEVDGLRPVVVSLADQPRGTIELGVGYSTNEGPGIDGRYLRYNRFGRADTLSFVFRLARIQSRVDLELSLPHWRRPNQTLALGVDGFNDRTDAYDEFGVGARTDLTRHLDKTTFRTIGIGVDVAQIDEFVPVERTRNFVTLGLLGAYSWDRSNDPLNPTSGWKLEARGEPTVSAGGGSSIYVRAMTAGSAYLALDDAARTVLAGRLKVGSILGASLDDIPASRRFYSGGGGSVRGYEFQGVGPRILDDIPLGGLGLFEASLEVRRQFTEKWGGVAFADVGGVSTSEAPDFSNVSTGVGFGVRYNLGFGPLRADLAVPLTRREGDPSYQIYLSIGQSF
jgi:translocation and assembly module TamA